MSRAVLSLGSNLGDRLQLLRDAVASFGTAVVGQSSVYRTPPWGPVAQDDYYNMIIVVENESIDASGWLAAAQRAEQQAGRKRETRWGPRTLDVDVISVENAGEPVVSEDPMLTLPHPRAAERAFVLLPWLEVEPAAELPGAGPISALLDGADLSGIHIVARQLPATTVPEVTVPEATVPEATLPEATS